MSLNRGVMLSYGSALGLKADSRTRDWGKNGDLGEQGEGGGKVDLFLLLWMDVSAPNPPLWAACAGAGSLFMCWGEVHCYTSVRLVFGESIHQSGLWTATRNMCLIPCVSFLGALHSSRAHLQSSMLCVDILNQKINKKMEGDDLQWSFQSKHFPKTGEVWAFWVESEQLYMGRKLMIPYGTGSQLSAAAHILFVLCHLS